jgi:uncharacterized BrkB/YihY/UPF0761 family membrane protein
MHLKNAYQIMKSALWDFVEDDAMTLGAALTFYTALSLAPLVLILLAITALLGPDLQEGIIEQVEGAAGPQAGATIAEITQTYVRFQGWPLQPDEDAERIPAAEKEELQEATSGRG